MAGLFSVGDPEAMFEHLKNKWVNFYKNAMVAIGVPGD
jgi:hypothetical protein